MSVFVEVYLYIVFVLGFFFFFKQKTAYEIVSGDWSSDVCSSDLREGEKFPKILGGCRQGARSGRRMRAQRAGDEAKSADKEDQHDEGVEKTSGAKIDVHVGENARENEERTCKSENP